MAKGIHGICALLLAAVRPNFQAIAQKGFTTTPHPGSMTRRKRKNQRISRSTHRLARPIEIGGSGDRCGIGGVCGSVIDAWSA
ncbi:hypothetical protein GGI42DRAFT_321794 [Trichoderma sp. SZMC 28013]